MKQFIIKTMFENGWNYLPANQLVQNLLSVSNYTQQEIEKTIKQMIKTGEMQLNGGKLVTSSFNGLTKAKIMVSKNGSYFCRPIDGSDDLYIAKENRKTALKDDIVLVKKLDSMHGKNYEAKIEKIVERGSTNIVGTVIDFTKKFMIVKPNDNTMKRFIEVPIEKTMGARKNEKVLVEISKIDDEKITGNVSEILGKEGSIKAETLGIIRSYKLREEFSEEINKIAKELPKEIDANSIKNRVDLRKLKVFTIDGIDAKDLDDAISITKNANGTLRLGVHIADVSSYVNYSNYKNDAIAYEAYKRGTSVYFPNLVLPMLPRELSNGICSLHPKVDRLTLSCFMDFDDNGNIVDYNICESVINSTERLNYDDINKLFDGDKEICAKYSNIYDDLMTMKTLASKLEQKRHDRGAIDFDAPELKIICDEFGEIDYFKARERGISERLIESFMIAANETVAEHFESKELPFIYRVHEQPDVEKLQAFKEYVSGLGVPFNCKADKVTGKKLQEYLESLEDSPLKDVINNVLLRSLKKAKYLETNLGHMGLGSECYCHFTSPIRRLADSVIHTIIKEDLHGVLDSKRKDFWSDYVADASLQASNTDYNAEKCERDVDDLYKAFYMSKHIGETFKGIISGVTNFGVFVKIENDIEGFIPVEKLPTDNYNFDNTHYKLTGGKNCYRLGDSIKIKVDNVQIRERKITFSTYRAQTKAKRPKFNANQNSFTDTDGSTVYL